MMRVGGKLNFWHGNMWVDTCCDPKSSIQNLQENQKYFLKAEFISLQHLLTAQNKLNWNIPKQNEIKKKTMPTLVVFCNHTSITFPFMPLHFSLTVNYKMSHLLHIPNWATRMKLEQNHVMCTVNTTPDWTAMNINMIFKQKIHL